MTTVNEKRAYNPVDIHRGLTNQIGENNCFLNVTIQALWHLRPFRVELQKFITRIEAGKSNHQKLTPGSLLESMCNLFVQYEFTDQKVLPPNELRESLCQLSGKYEFGKIADANETLDTILHRIHAEQSASCPQMKKCLSHKVFGGLVMEQTICTECRANSEPMLRDDFMSCVQAMELITEAKEMMRARLLLKPIPDSEFKDHKEPRGRGGIRMPAIFGRKSPEHAGPSKSSNSLLVDAVDPPITGLQSNDFGFLLHRCMEVSQRSCPANDEPDRPKDLPLCKGKGKVCFFSLEPPLALALSVGWTQANEDSKTLRDFYSIISDTIQLSDLFSGAGAGLTNGQTYTFRGLVCYYGLHYVSIFQEMDCNRFLLFDDQKVRVIGDWNAVKEECIKSKYQPVLLLYELNKTTAYMVNTESDDELELALSEKAKNSTRAQKVHIENDLKEEMEEESKTGDAFVLTPSPSNLTNNAATVAAVVNAPSAIENLIDLTDDDKPGPFTSPARVSEQKSSDHKTINATPSNSEPRIIAAVPIVGTSPLPFHGTNSTIGTTSTWQVVTPSRTAATVVGSTQTTFGRDMFAPQEDTDMGRFVGSVPSIGVPTKAEPKHGNSSNTPSSHSSASQSGSGGSAAHSDHKQPVHSTPVASSDAKHHHHPSSSSSSSTSHILTPTASQALLQGLHLLPTEHLVIDKWSYRPMRYNVVLKQELIGNGKKSIGVNVVPGPDGKPIVSSFFPHPVTRMQLPAQRSGVIQPGDRIVTINDIELRDYDLDLIMSVLMSCETVTLTMASKVYKTLWYTCPRCTISNIVDTETETKLKRYNANRLLNEMKRGMLDQKGYLLRCVMCRSENEADTTMHD